MYIVYKVCMYNYTTVTVYCALYRVKYRARALKKSLCAYTILFISNR